MIQIFFQIFIKITKRKKNHASEDSTEVSETSCDGEIVRIPPIPKNNKVDQENPYLKKLNQ